MHCRIDSASRWLSTYRSRRADETETPLQEETRLADEKMEAEIAKLQSDPNVKTLQDMFGAELKTVSVQILDAPRND